MDAELPFWVGFIISMIGLSVIRLRLASARQARDWARYPRRAAKSPRVGAHPEARNPECSAKSAERDACQLGAGGAATGRRTTRGYTDQSGGKRAAVQTLARMPESAGWRYVWLAERVPPPVLSPPGYDAARRLAELPPSLRCGATTRSGRNATPATKGQCGSGCFARAAAIPASWGNWALTVHGFKLLFDSRGNFATGFKKCMLPGNING